MHKAAPDDFCTVSEVNFDVIVFVKLTLRCVRRDLSKFLSSFLRSDNRDFDLSHSAALVRFSLSAKTHAKTWITTAEATFNVRNSAISPGFRF